MMPTVGRKKRNSRTVSFCSPLTFHYICLAANTGCGSEEKISKLILFSTHLSLYLPNISGTGLYGQIINRNSKIMSEELNPGAGMASDVLESANTAEPQGVETVTEETVRTAEPETAEVPPGTAVTEEAAQKEQAPDYGGMSLAELSQVFEKFSESIDRLTRSKEAESIKAAFYKRLSKEKMVAGLEAPEVPSEGDEPAPEQEQPVQEEKPAEEAAPAIAGPFAALENGFRTLYLKYKISGIQGDPGEMAFHRPGAGSEFPRPE